MTVASTYRSGRREGITTIPTQPPLDVQRARELSISPFHGTFSYLWLDTSKQEAHVVLHDDTALGRVYADASPAIVEALLGIHALTGLVEPALLQVAACFAGWKVADLELNECTLSEALTELEQHLRSTQRSVLGSLPAFFKELRAWGDRSWSVTLAGGTLPLTAIFVLNAEDTRVALIHYEGDGP